MRRALTPIAVAAALAGAAPSAAWAAERTIYSYDAVSQTARNLTGAGLTLTFEKGLLSTRVREVRATGVPVGAKVKPLGDGKIIHGIDEALGKDAGRGALYEVMPDAMQGNVMIHAFCPGSSRAWLAIGRLDHGDDLTVQAFGDNPSTGKPRFCATMDFSWRGEWKLPPKGGLGNPLKSQFQPDYHQPGS